MIPAAFVTRASSVVPSSAPLHNDMYERGDWWRRLQQCAHVRLKNAETEITTSVRKHAANMTRLCLYARQLSTGGSNSRFYLNIYGEGSWC